MSKVVQFQNDNKKPIDNLALRCYELIKKSLELGERLEGIDLKNFQRLLSDRKSQLYLNHKMNFHFLFFPFQNNI